MKKYKKIKYYYKNNKFVLFKIIKNSINIFIFINLIIKIKIKIK